MVKQTSIVVQKWLVIAVTVLSSVLQVTSMLQKKVDFTDAANIDKAFAKVAVEADDTDNSITITLAGAVNQFCAMYYLASSLYQPVPLTRDIYSRE